MKLCASPREAAERSDIIISMISDTAALSAITEGANGVLAGLSPGKIYIDMSTVSPRLIRDLAQRVAQTGAHMLEAPVSGSVPAVEAGTLVAFVGGDAAVLEQARPVLEGLCQKIVHMGGNGQGISTKIAINLSLTIQLVALFEGLLLAERSGVPRAAALDAMLNSAIAAPAMKYRAPFIFKMPDEVWFSVAMMEKDVDLALEMGDELGVPLQTARLSRDVLAKAHTMGYSEQDFAAVFHVVAQMAGVTG
jgi:3-hydroxyisobutyrate dehydrogenase-like beta-hydroxyacid dehydrogenase